VLHEIAHAIAGWDAGHGYQWQRVARNIGCDAITCYSKANVKTPDAPYEFYCETCGKTSPRFKRSRKSPACGRCCRVHNYGRYTPKFALIFRRTQKKNLTNAV